MEFVDKTVLVTGAATGIGRATALAFARLGAKVCANYVADDESIHSLKQQALSEQLNIITLQADVRDAVSVHTMFEQMTKMETSLDVLVNNAGISIVRPFLDLSESEWDKVIDTDLKSVFLCSQAALKLMVKQNSGVIVNVASELGFSGRAEFSAYTAAKGGVISLTRSLAREFAPNIRINAVAPGPTETPLLAKELAIPGHKEDISDIPLARYAKAEEIADSILFLASDKSRYYCGDVISPNGGAVMR